MTYLTEHQTILTTLAIKAYVGKTKINSAKKLPPVRMNVALGGGGGIPLRSGV